MKFSFGRFSTPSHMLLACLLTAGVALAGAPTITSVTLVPSVASETTTLTCSPAASDPDNDPITYAYGWKVNGTSITATTRTLTGAYFAKGNTVNCTATPTDGNMNGTTVASNSLVIANSPPALSGVTLTPPSPTVSSTLTCTPVGASDPDGDAVAFIYAWTLNGVRHPNTLDSFPPGKIAVGSRVKCTIIPGDSAAKGPAVSSTEITLR